jgi:hypothetical protein
VAKTYPENWTMYIEADPKIKLQWAYNRSLYREIKAKETVKALQNYNEFDL